MTTKATTTTASTTATQPVRVAGIGDAFSMLMQTTVSSLSMVNNLAVAGENITGILADKSVNFREQQAIAETMKHNHLMANLQKQASDLGIEL